MASLLAAWSSFIFLQFDGIMIILIDNIAMNIVYLLFQEVLVPDNLCRYIVGPNKLVLVWTLSA